MNKDSTPFMTVKETFTTIASDYDRMNSILSMRMHNRWNRELADTVKGAHHLLDLCAGTGEIAFHFLKENPQSLASLLDFCPEMLAIAKDKGSCFEPRFIIQEGDAQKLPFDDAVFDAATVAYGIRNVENPLLCFYEVYRVLQAGGRFAILELTRPSGLLLLGHRLYLRLVPLLGKLCARKEMPYSYLKDSIQKFTAPSSLMEQMREVGFVNIQSRKLLGGTATLIWADKC